MSKGITIICDRCNLEEKLIKSVYGRKIRWITISRSESMSGDKIGAGELHFCSEKCIIEYCK